MGSLPHMTAKRLFRVGTDRRGRRSLQGSAFYPHKGIAAEAMFRLCRNGEFVLPPKRRHFTSETAKHRGFCEAASLTALGPYGQKAHEPGDLQGDLESPCTRFLWFVSLTCVKEMNNNLIKVRKLCSHNPPRHFVQIPLLRFVYSAEIHLLPPEFWRKGFLSPFFML